MSFIISRGYAEVQILKTSESDLSAFGTFWYVYVQILKKVKLKKTLHIFICKKKVQTHLDIIFLYVT